MRWAHAVPFLALGSPAGRTVVVGDPHGCAAELRALLARIDLRPEDRLIAVGDLVDRGPGSLELLRFFAERPDTHTVLGNHEHKLARVLRGTAEGAWTQQQTAAQIPAPERAAWAAWIERLPLVIETPEVLVVHAGLDPDRAVSDQDAFHACTLGGPRAEIPLDDDGVPRWHRVWRERTGSRKPVCIGHLGYARIALIPGALYALDAGAAGGGHLAALILPEGRVVTERVETDHFARAREAWRDEMAAGRDPLAEPIREILGLEGRVDATAAERAQVAALRSRLAGLDLSREVAALRQAAARRFGPLPAPGPARGDWARRVRARLEGLPPALAKIVASARESTDEETLRALGGESVAAMEAALAEAGRRLCGEGAEASESGSGDADPRCP